MVLALEVTYPQELLTLGKPGQLVTLIEIEISAICWMHDLEVKSFNLLVFDSRKLVLEGPLCARDTVLEHSPCFPDHTGTSSPISRNPAEAALGLPCA